MSFVIPGCSGQITQKPIGEDMSPTGKEPSWKMEQNKVKRQRAVELIKQGLSNREIALQIGRSIEFVKKIRKEWEA